MHPNDVVFFGDPELNSLDWEPTEAVRVLTLARISANFDNVATHAIYFIWALKQEGGNGVTFADVLKLKKFRARVDTKTGKIVVTFLNIGASKRGETNGYWSSICNKIHDLVTEKRKVETTGNSRRNDEDKGEQHLEFFVIALMAFKLRFPYLEYDDKMTHMSRLVLLVRAFFKKTTSLADAFRSLSRLTGSHPRLEFDDEETGNYVAIPSSSDELQQLKQWSVGVKLRPVQPDDPMFDGQKFDTFDEEAADIENCMRVLFTSAKRTKDNIFEFGNVEHLKANLNKRKLYVCLRHLVLHARCALCKETGAYGLKSENKFDRWVGNKRREKKGSEFASKMKALNSGPIGAIAQAPPALEAPPPLEITCAEADEESTGTPMTLSDFNPNSSIRTEGRDDDMGSTSTCTFTCGTEDEEEKSFRISCVMRVFEEGADEEHEDIVYELRDEIAQLQLKVSQLELDKLELQRHIVELEARFAARSNIHK